MKKLLGIILALSLALVLLAGCGEPYKDPPADKDVLQDDAGTQTPADPKPADTTQQAPAADDGIPELVKPWDLNPLNGSFISPEAEALVTVSKAYLAREIWLQYDCSRLMEDVSGVTKVTRPQYHVNSPEDCTSQNTGYTNCSAFTYDVFWETFGLDIICFDENISSKRAYHQP